MVINHIKLKVTANFKCFAKSSLVIIFVSLSLWIISGCHQRHENLQLVALQHISRAVAANNDPCQSLYRDDGLDIVTPTGFKISPQQAITIAKERLGYSCNHRFGALIFADDRYYYIVRAEDIKSAIAINGVDGSIKSKGFMNN